MEPSNQTTCHEKYRPTSIPVRTVSRCKYLRYDIAMTSYTVILLTTEDSQISGICHMLEPKEINQDKSVPPMSSQIPSEDGHD